MTELGNTTLESLGILTGAAGRDAALADPDQWEAKRFGETSWSPYSVWCEWCCKKLMNDHTQWRRVANPEPVRPTRLEATTYFLRKGEMVSIGIPHENSTTVQLVLHGYDGKRAHITVEEHLGDSITLQPVEPPTGAPGTIITWQRAQERVDAGLAVETLLSETLPEKAWVTLIHPDVSYGNMAVKPGDHRDWTYRVPLQPAQPEPVTMTAQAAMERELSRHEGHGRGASRNVGRNRREGVGRMKLSELYTTARRFVDGVCAIPSMGPKLDNVHAVLSQAFQQVDTDESRQLDEEIEQLEQQLSAEREAHGETKQRWATVSDEWNDAAEECTELRKQLAAARADLEALTRWSSVLCELPLNTRIWQLHVPSNTVSLVDVAQLRAAQSVLSVYNWRHTPESLADWKVREGGGE